MKNFLSTIGKKNIIIISGILLIGVAVYLNLSVGNPFMEENQEVLDDIINYDDYILESQNNFETPDTDENGKTLGQAALVDNLNLQNVNFVEEVPNDSLSNSNDDTLGEENYFAVAVVNRQRARDESIELLQNIVDTAEALPNVVDNALEDMRSIADDIEKEANIETIIKAKGFSNCVAIVNGENANIIVKTDGLMPNEVAQIKEVVFEQSGIIPSNVKIVEKN